MGHSIQCWLPKKDNSLHALVTAAAALMRRAPYVRATRPAYLVLCVHVELDTLFCRSATAAAAAAGMYLRAGRSRLTSAVVAAGRHHLRRMLMTLCDQSPSSPLQAVRLCHIHTNMILNMSCTLYEIWANPFSVMTGAAAAQAAGLACFYECTPACAATETYL